MDQIKFNQQISFIKEIDKLKYVLRKTRLFGSDRFENDAEHCWHLAMMTLILSEYSNEEIDVLKVIKMVLIHDLVEIDAGDVFLFDTRRNETYSRAELKAAQRIFGLLPDKQAKEFLDLWKEFESGDSPEARFARSMDHLEPMLQNFSNKGGTWQEFGIPFQIVYEKKKMIREGSTVLWDYAEDLLDESVEKGILSKVLVLRTDAREDLNQEIIASIFNEHPGLKNWNFDFEDSDNIFRVESTGITIEEVVGALASVGIEATELPD